jgi:hypothetical protein
MTSAFFCYSRKNVMPDKDPANIPLITYAWVFGMSVLGGVASFMKKLKDGHARAFNVIELIGEMATSALVGVVTFFLCESAEMDRVKSAALVAVAGHMGSKAIRLLEQILSKQFK